jgi:multidrug resistance efflux pump
MKSKTCRKLFFVAVGLGAATLLMAGCGQSAANNSNSAQNGQTATPSGTPTTVTTGTVETTIVATGKVVARDLADVAFQRSGQIISVTVQEGQMVKVGQPLAYLDQSGLSLALQSQYDAYVDALATYSQTIQGPSTSDLASAKSAISSAQASYNDLLKPPTDTSLANLKASMDNAKAALDQAQSSYDRAFKKDPAGIGGSSESLALQQATNDYIAAKANYDNAFQPASNGSLATAAANIDAAVAKLNALYPVTETVIQAQAKLDQALVAYQQAQQDISNTVIYAPYDGMVTQVAYNVGDTIAANQMVVEVADVSNPWFEVQVDEADIGNVRIGQPSFIQLQAYPNVPISATVESIASSGTTNNSSVTFLVKLALGNVMADSPMTQTASTYGPRAQSGQGQRNAQGQGQRSQGQTNQTQGQTQRSGQNSQYTRPIVRLGMSGTGQVVTARVANAVVVPSAALVTDRTTRSLVVYKINGSTTQPVTVTVGLRDTNSNTAQIISGVSAGDTILVPHATNTTNSSTGGGGGRGPFGFFGG